MSFGYTLFFPGYINLQKTPIFIDILLNFWPKCSIAVSKATGHQIGKYIHGSFVLGDYTQTVKVSSKSVTMRAHPCLVLTENG